MQMFRLVMVGFYGKIPYRVKINEKNSEKEIYFAF